MAEQKKGGDKKKYAETPHDTRSLRDAAEKHLAGSQENSFGLTGQTAEELIHELRVHQIELETQAEELRRIRDELEISRYKYIDLYDFAPVGYLTLNDKAVVTEANLTAATLLGVERRTLVRARFRKYVFPGDLETWDQYFTCLLRQDMKQSCTVALVRGDGSTFPARMESVRHTIEDGSNAIHLTISDNTDIKKVQDALRDSEEKYRVLFTRMIDGSALHELVYDASLKPVDYRILDVNPAFERIIRLSRQDVNGKTSREVYSVDTPPFLDIYTRVATTSLPEEFETYYAPLKKHFAISVYSPGKGRFVTIFQDITERKQAESFRELLIHELEQKNTELDQFTYTVSHDLKSPLLTIRGFLGLLERDLKKNDATQVQVDITHIISAAEKMEYLITTLLELSRSGRTVNTPVRIPFADLAREAAGLLEFSLQECGVKLIIPENLPVVSGDRQRLLQVMTNLLDNSVKYMGDQEDPRIEIGVRDDDGTPVFFVQDNGMGIKKENLSKVFLLFERFNTKVPGTGIGLTTVRRIIETHGGKIWVESEGEGKGTTVCFTLPVVPKGNANKIEYH